MKFTRNLFVIFVLLFIASSCKKRVYEIVPVIEIEKDLSILGAGNIKYFSFPSSQIGFAASDTNFIYKTVDGGNNWSIINIGSYGDCKGIEFFDDSNGMCVMGETLYTTDDGGQTWERVFDADFIGITEDGIGVVVNYINSWKCTIMATDDKGDFFGYMGTVILDGKLTNARVVDSKVILITDYAYSNDRIFGFNMSDSTDFKIYFDNIAAQEDPNDFYLSEGKGTLVGNLGLIMDNEMYGYRKNYWGHSYKYNSVDGYGDLVVCVGKKTITSNIDIGNDDTWNEVFDKNGNGFDDTFYRIRFIDQETFYVSGNNGLILKARI